MSDRFVFVGNRRFVLEQMLADNINFSAIVVIAGSHLERDLQAGLLVKPETLSKAQNYHVVKNKQELLGLLKSISFDILVSNGCPYILPISELPAARYVNIHPSFLPDLRGADPNIGAILFGRDAGATCHVMDDGVDTGPIIAQIRIPLTEDLDVTTLYQLSFIAERKVFSESLKLSFVPQFEQSAAGDLLYYSRKPEDRLITFHEPNSLLLRKIRAFNNRKAGCEFRVNGSACRVFSAQLMSNPFLAQVLSDFPDYMVALSYENSIIFKKDGDIIRFCHIEVSGNDQIPVGVFLLDK